MERFPFFSIVIPAYKKQYLYECIDSILTQTYTNFELIIVNDASPEDLDSVIKQFNDDRIRYYVNSKNCGAFNVVDNWNICLSYAVGDFIVCMGDDDKMMPNYLEEFKRLIDEYPKLNVYHCRSFIINENSEIINITPSWPLFESVYENIWHRINGFRVQFISDFVYRTAFLKNQGGFYKLPLAWASDDISSFIAMREFGVAHIHEPVFCYRQTAITISSSGSVLQKIKAIEAEEIWYEEFLYSLSPTNLVDKIALNNIHKTYKHYFKMKRLNTVAYFGIKGSIVYDFIFWIRNRNATKLSLSELIYACILSAKKRLANK